MIRQLVSVCGKCDIIAHSRCTENHKFKTFRDKFFCQGCMKSHEILRYNPLYDILEKEDDNFFDEQPTEYIDSLQELSEI